MLNSRPVKLHLGTYSKGGGGQEVESPRLMDSNPRGTSFMIVMIRGWPVLLRYGGPVARSLVAEFGLDVLRMPEICFTLRPHQRSILHVGESWVQGPNYLFVSLSTRDSLTVVPFDLMSTGTFTNLVLIIPRGWATTGYGFSTRNLSLL